MNYQIIATVGPKSNRPEIWEDMLAVGVTDFRLNTSHISLAQLKDWLNKFQLFFSHIRTDPALILDLQGSKWRIGEIQNRNLIDGQTVYFIPGETAENSDFLPVPHTDFFDAARSSDGAIKLNDAKVNLQLEEVKPNLISARVIQGGVVSSHKGITFENSDFRKENLNEKDLAIINHTRKLSFVQFALSYVKDAVELQNLQSKIGRSRPLIAKLERQPAVNEVEQIAGLVEGVWLCRGDLGSELGLRSMAETVHCFSDSVKEIQVPVVLAGQVLEHMTDHHTPTRAELCNLYDALEKGYRGVVLSDETAIGIDPVGAARAAAIFRDL